MENELKITIVFDGKNVFLNAPTADKVLVLGVMEMARHAVLAAAPLSAPIAPEIISPNGEKLN